MQQYNPNSYYYCIFCGKPSYNVIPYDTTQRPIVCCEDCKDVFLEEKEYRVKVLDKVSVRRYYGRKGTKTIYRD